MKHSVVTAKSNNPAYDVSATAWNATHTFDGQLAFPATQNPSSDPNTQDDYEEGTWTPGLSFGGGTTGLTFTVQSGLYRKYGSAVYASFQIVLNAKGSSTGAALLTGLPFAALNSGGQGGGPAIYYNGLTVTGPPVFAVTPNATTAAIYLGVANTVGTAAETNFNNGAYLYGVVSYVASN